MINEFSMSTSKKEINNLHQSDLYLYFYEDAVDESRTRMECTYIEKHCGISGQQRILDLAEDLADEAELIHPAQLAAEPAD